TGVTGDGHEVLRPCLRLVCPVETWAVTRVMVRTKRGPGSSPLTIPALRLLGCSHDAQPRQNLERIVDARDGSGQRARPRGDLDPQAGALGLGFLGRLGLGDVDGGVWLDVDGDVEHGDGPFEGMRGGSPGDYLCS